MGHREHLDESPAHLIYHIVRESGDEAAASGRAPWCTGRRMSGGSSRSCAGRAAENGAGTGDRRIVVIRTIDKLVAGLGMELSLTVATGAQPVLNLGKDIRGRDADDAPAGQLPRAPINLLVPDGVGVWINILAARREEFGEPRPIQRGKRE